MLKSVQCLLYTEAMMYCCFRLQRNSILETTSYCHASCDHFLACCYWLCTCYWFLTWLVGTCIELVHKHMACMWPFHGTSCCSSNCCVLSCKTAVLPGKHCVCYHNRIWSNIRHDVPCCRVQLLSVKSVLTLSWFKRPVIQHFSFQINTSWPFSITVC